MHSFTTYLVVDHTRHAPKAHTVSEHDDLIAAQRAANAHSYAFPTHDVTVVAKHVQEN